MIYVAGVRVGGKSVWAYNNAGVLQWSYDTGGQARRVLTDAANNVYIGGAKADNGDGNGTRNLWKLNSLGEYITGVHVQGSAQVYDIALDSNYIYVATAAGAARLTASLGSETDIVLLAGIAGGIAVDSDGNIFIGGYNPAANLYKYDSGLVQKWTKTPKAVANVRGVDILSNGNVVIGFETGDSDTVWCYDTDGTKQWDNSEAATVVYCIAIADDIVYVGGSTAAKQFVAIDADGNTLYSIDIGNTVWDIGVTSDGVPYLATNRAVGTDSVYKVDTDAETAAAFADTVGHCYGVTGEGTISTSFLVEKKYSKKLMAVANNQLWYESAVDTMAVLDASAVYGELDTSLPLSMFEAYQKLFIINKSNFKIADFVNVKLTTNAGGIGANPPDHGNLLTCALTGAKIVVDYITSFVDDAAVTIYGKRITATKFSSADVIAGTDDDDNVISITLGADEAAGPFWYDYTTYGNAAGSDTTYGALPSKATLGCLYRGRVVISGDPSHPNEWYMSRQAHPFDFVVTSADVQSAIAGNNTDAGEVGDIVTCLIPYKDDYLVFGCASSIWLLAGDPRSGGTLGEFSLTTGIFGPQSFCWDDQDNLYFWGINGIYKATVPGNCICLTKDALPDIVADEAINFSTHRITMSYDRQRYGIQVCITVLATGVNSNYFYDLATEGFFPESYPTTSGMFSLFNYDAESPGYRKMIMGCNDGYLRYFNNSLKSDNDTADAVGVGTIPIDSHVTFGPLQMGDTPAKEGKLTGLILVSAGGASGGSDSNDIDCEVFVAWSAEEIIEKLTAATRVPNFSKTITAPGRSRGNSLRRKIRGVYAGLRLGNNTVGETWGFEQLIVDSKVSGRLK